MKRLRRVIAAAVLLVGVACAESVAGQAPCVIVKHKGTLGRRLMFGALIGVPIAPGAKYDLVEAKRYPAAKMAYHGRELEALQSAGVHVVVLETHYSTADLEGARRSCAEGK